MDTVHGWKEENARSIPFRFVVVVYLDDAIEFLKILIISLIVVVVVSL